MSIGSALIGAITIILCALPFVLSARNKRKKEAFFLKSLSENLDSLEDNYKLKNIVSKSVQKINDIEENEKIITIDDTLIKNEKDFMSMLENQYDHEILGKAFEKNTKIQMKLKMNIREYIIVTNLLYPTLIKVYPNDY
jgi:hypothetical protein